MSIQVARDAVLKFRPDISITSYHANVKDPDFNVDFFKQFNVVMNGLDNLDARRHVNRLCLASGVPLIESGTTGFLGQVAFSYMKKFIEFLSVLYYSCACSIQIFSCTIFWLLVLKYSSTCSCFGDINLLSLMLYLMD